MWAKAVLLSAVVAAVTWIWARRRSEMEPAGAPALAAVTALLVLSPLFSVQYTAWLVPWAAVAALGARRERTMAGLAFAVISHRWGARSPLRERHTGGDHVDQGATACPQRDLRVCARLLVQGRVCQGPCLAA